MAEDPRTTAKVSSGVSFVMIHFPNREPVIMRNHLDVLALILDLNEAYKKAWKEEC